MVTSLGDANTNFKSTNNRFFLYFNRNELINNA